MDFLKRLIRFWRRSGWYVVADAAIVVIAYWVALPLRFAGAAPSHYLDSWRYFIPWIVLVHVVANAWAGLYSRLWRYASAPDSLIIAQAWLAATVPLAVLDYFWRPRPLPLSTVLLGGFLSLAGFTALRYRSRLLASAMYRFRRALEHNQLGSRHSRTRVLIVGAGETGQTLSWQLQNRRRGEAYQVVGFIDDDANKLGLNVHGSPVLGTRDQIPEIVAGHGIDLIVLAIHAVSGQEFREIIRVCQDTTAQIKIVPDVFESLAGNSHAPLVRDVTVRDFLGRTSTEIDLESCRSILESRVVVVTGGAGSIGAELCRQVLAFSPERVIAVDVNESGLYELETELRIRGQAANFLMRVADVTDEVEMRAIFAKHRPHVVFHAAAYKHVPLMEWHPRMAIRTNVLGALTVGRAAGAVNAERFVFVSTDKAVSPTGVMGATKRLGECLTVGLSSESTTTRFTAVRFGNVLASRGSVVPLFERQISAGGPVTVTHPDTTRFFMTLPEAVRLVLQAAALTQGGDLFMLDMGERIRILDLAERIIRLRGLRPEVDIPIEFTGLRPGEKLHEDLLAEHERRAGTSHPNIYRVLNRKGALPDGGVAAVEGWIQTALLGSDDRLGSDLVGYAQRL